MKEDLKPIVNAGIKKATAEFTQRMETLGFKRTKKWFWVRIKPQAADFIHLHLSGSSYGAPINYSVTFRAHCGYRNLNSSFEALALNGPNSDLPELREKGYHLRFNAKSGSTYERCINDLNRFVVEVGESWFKTQLKSDAQDQTLLPENIIYSYKLLGIKGVKG